MTTALECDRIPPQSLEMEQATLGVMLIDRSAVDEVFEECSSEDFYKDAHRAIYEAIASIAERNEPIDLLSVQEQLKRLELLEAIGGSPYLVQLTDAFPTIANARYYAKIVRGKAVLRRLGTAGNQIFQLANDPEAEMDTATAESEKILNAATDRNNHSEGLTPTRLIMDDCFEEFDARANNPKKLAGISTGLTKLDFMIGGFRPGFYVVGARTSMGKTALAVSSALHIAAHSGPVAFFSLEMDRQEIGQRLIAAEAKISLHGIFCGNLMDWQCRLYGEAVSRISEKLKIAIDDEAGISATTMRGRLRRMIRDTGALSLVIVDYLQLVRPNRPSRSSDNRVQELGAVSRELKELSKEFRLPVLALAQLSRATETRTGNRPALSDLRESGSIEAEADVVALLYRENYYLPEDKRMYTGPDRMEAVEVNIAKNRNGPTGMFRAAFFSQFARFDNLTQDPEPAARQPYADA